MIDVQQISRFYGSFAAVDGISFSVAKGEIVGLLGPNGAGKTTTMRMITGFLEPSSGTILIDGKNILDDPRAAKQKIGYMSEAAPLYGDMITADYLDYVAGVHGVNADVQIPHLAQLCGLTEVMHKNISELSRGYRQRVGLAHALMNDPEILILDEPTSGLDPNQIIEVRKVIKEIGKTRTVIISTHILGEVEMLCDRVIIISRGKIVADSPTSEIRTRFGQSSSICLQVAGCRLSDLENALKPIAGISAVSVSSGELHSPDGPLSRALLSIEGDKDLRGAVFSCICEKKWVLYEMSLERNSLEDVFRTLTTGGEKS